jgi:dihydrodipicolinate synthase/N-acetylneuraminate lyase
VEVDDHARLRYPAVARAERFWSGVFPVLCTPFADDGAVDLDGQRAVVRFALASGAHGLVCFGLGAEVNKLTPEERLRLTDAILEQADRRVPVLIGVAAESSHTAVALARSAEQAGADGVVVPPPFTAGLGGDDLAGYFRTVTGAVSLPVMVQDAHVYLGSALSPQLVRRLAREQPNVRYVKIEAGPEETRRWVEEVGPDVSVFTGDAGIHLLPCLRAGAVGSIPAVELVDRLVAVYAAERRGDGAGAEALFRPLLPYLVFALEGGIDHCNAATKATLVRRGVLSRGGLRQPAPDFGPLFDELAGAHAAALDLAASPAAV